MKRGFTILELLVVISVLVILIGIALPRFKGMQDAARIAEARAELRTMQAAVESYYANADPHAFPASSDTLASNVLASATPRIVPDSVPYDPFGSSTSTEYKYIKSSGSGLYYVIGSVGTGTDLSTLAVSTSGTVTKATGNYCVTNGTGC